MKRLGMAAAFPLVSQGELLGYLLLGEKMSEESYSKEDLLLLRIVANQAALAYQRVRYLEMAVHGARTEMLGEIAGGFAHEIKTPLTNISLPAELSIMDLVDVEKGEKKLEDVLPELEEPHAGHHAADDEGVGENRGDPPVFQARPRPAGGRGLVRHPAEQPGPPRPPAAENQHRSARNSRRRMAPIQGDAKQLEIVFVNLIKNAAEAMTQHTSAGPGARALAQGA